LVKTITLTKRGAVPRLLDEMTLTHGDEGYKTSRSEWRISSISVIADWSLRLACAEQKAT